MATVRIYTYAELISIKVNSGQLSTDSIYLLREPYLGGEVLAPSTSVAANSLAATAPRDTRVLKVQIDGGLRCHYEVTPQGHNLRTATTSSPILNGDDLINFAQGYRISVLEENT